MAKTIRRLIGALCIITAVLVTQIPTRMIAASNAKEDFLLDHDVLVKYTGTATTVSVSDDIKVIGEEAFADNQYIGIVNFGKNVKEIEHGAFANCTYLDRVVITDSIEEIDSAAFSGCTSLKNIALGSNVEKIGDAVFAGCKNLGGISIPKKNDRFRFEAGVLYDKNKEKIYTYLMKNPYDIYYMPNSVSKISPYSFWGNEDLEEAYLSANLEEIPAYSFSNCKNLKVVQIPYSVNSIDAKAFENCISIKDIIIPASVKYIDPTAFDGCYNLNIIADEGTAAAEFFRTFDKRDIAVSESQDAKNVIKNLENNENKKNETEVNEINSSTGLKDASKDPSNVDWMPSVNPLIQSDDSSVLGKTIVVSGRAVLFVDRDMEVYSIDNPYSGKANNSSDTTLGECADSTNSSTGEATDATEDNSSNQIYDSGKGGYLPKYTYVDGRIASQAFYASKNNDDFIIPPGTKSVGDFSFARSTVTNITIPDGVEKIGYGAFYHCDNLQDVSIPSSVKEIEGHAFDNTPFMSKISSDVNGSPFTIVGDGILLAYSGNNQEVVIPEGVRTISSGCFEGNSLINKVSLPDSVTIIDSDAFRDCSNLSYVNGGNNLEEIRDRAFMGCPVKSFLVGGSVKKIGLKAFDFSSTDINDDEKVIAFNGTYLPDVRYDKTSSRLSNSDYRQDALYNVLFAIVKDDNINLSDSVLDNNTLGFSGLVMTLEKDEQGIETGYADVIANYIYSEEVLAKLPDSFKYNNKEYIINDFNELTVSSNPYSANDGDRNIEVVVSDDLDVDDYKATLSEKEKVGKIYIKSSEFAGNLLNNAYGELFGGESIGDLTSYEIELKDEKNIVNIDKLGKSTLYITVPVDGKGEKYHVISLDSDNQLEELPAMYNPDEKSLTFETSHLSYFGIYSTDKDNIVLNLKDGKIVKNYRLDSSPDTGDKSLSIYYVLSILLCSTGLLLMLVKGKKKQ